MNKVIISIHQPNFFPWLGYFAKIAEASVFVILDEVAYPRNSWVNRVKMARKGGAHWMTCPVRRAASGTPVRDIRINTDDHHWKKDIIGWLQAEYARAPRFQAVMGMVRSMFEADDDSLADFNIKAIRTIARMLELDTSFVLQSELTRDEVRTKRGSERLGWICHELGADIYLAGTGSGTYEVQSVYKRMNIEYRTLAFTHPVYDQSTSSGTFIPGLSVLDALFHVEPQQVAGMLTQTNGAAMTDRPDVEWSIIE